MCKINNARRAYANRSNLRGKQDNALICQLHKPALQCIRDAALNISNNLAL